MARGKFYQLNLKTDECKEFSMDENIEFDSLKFSYVRGRLFVFVRNHANKETRGIPMEYDIATGKYRAIPEEIVDRTLV